MAIIIWPQLLSLWTHARLGDVAKIIMGQSPPGDTYNEQGNGLPFFQGKAEFGELVPTEAKWCTSPSRIAEAEDILISIRAPVGPTNIAKERCCIGRGLAAIRVDADIINRDFLLYYFRFVEPALSGQGQGSTFEAINKSDLLTFKVIVPPLPEQQLIVDILKQADELRRLRHHTIEEARKLPAALFMEMFGDPINNSKAYRKRPLEELGELDRGVSKHRPRDAPFLFGGPYPFIQTGDVTNSDGWITEFNQTYSEAGLSQSKLWPKGTLCITIAANIAKTGILTFEACFPDSVVGFSSGESVTTEYVMYAINLYQGVLEAQAPQAAQKNINLQVLRSLQLPVPPKELQDEFSFRIEEIRQIIRMRQTNVNKFDELIHSMNAEAFSGQLTEAWREKKQDELKAITHSLDSATRKLKHRVEITEIAPPKLKPPSIKQRHWLIDQLSKIQATILTALQHEWKRILIPSEDLDLFCQQCSQIEHLEDAHDQIKRALNQLADLGLIAKVSLPGQAGEYVTGYRALREDELTWSSDLRRLESS